MFLAQSPLTRRRHCFRQLKRLLLSTDLAVDEGEVVHREEDVWMFLIQRPLMRRHHRFHQLKRLLPSTDLTSLYLRARACIELRVSGCSSPRVLLRPATTVSVR